MKIIIFLVLASGLLAQPEPPKPAPPLPLPIEEVNQKFLRACAEGEKLFLEVKQGNRLVNADLVDLVLRLEYDLITKLENGTKKEIDLLKPARTCTKSVAERVQVYIKKTNRKVAQISEKSKFQ